MEWYEAGELQCMIDSAMERIVGDCSLLIVCLMSHGSRGVLKGQGGEEIAVNDILHQFTYTLPESVPLVRELTRFGTFIHINLFSQFKNLPEFMEK